MDFIWGTEWCLILALLVHLIMTPFTKVEESFNVQAIHDILYTRTNVTMYDHHQFPGVVPRTFAGPLAISAVVSPLVPFFYAVDAPKYWMLFWSRLALGLGVLLSFCNFARCVGEHLGRDTANFLRLIVASQFHFLFYASRPLPNTFALIAVLWVYQLWFDGNLKKAVSVATVATFLFRFELVLLFGPIFLVEILWKRIGLFSAIGRGLVALAAVLLITVPIDSFFWGRWVWPEGEVIWFNVVENRSHEYGTSPYHYYFLNALPRALGASLLLAPLGLFADRRIWRVVAPVVVFLGLYSFLPHKELRFIIYSFPILNLPAAALCARLWINREKSIFRKLVALAFSAHLLMNLIMTGVLLYASSQNYPGGEALGYLQHMHRFRKNSPIAVHIDAQAAQTGISRFVQVYDAWEYNKSETLTDEEKQRFDYIVVGTAAGESVEDLVQRRFSSSHKLHFKVNSFSSITYKRSSQFPFFWPVLRFKHRIGVLKKLD
ncbi:hypothetical protein QR680_006415 [Steinernema hermaphroditum]|uniref:Mannosyltransferase n=1 Tax=Steinernema hermaphroditum TaxID=289476 RepID=A0AA39HXK6_9BILA|nr:hypothetical protein QR680_006415 [Steinernema hermaphroditum]